MPRIATAMFSRYAGFSPDAKDARTNQEWTTLLTQSFIQSGDVRQEIYRKVPRTIFSLIVYNAGKLET